MLAYIRALIKILFRRLGPEDLPDSAFLLGFTFAVYLFLQVTLAWILFGPSLILAKTVAIDMSMLVFCLWAVLRLVGYLSRFRQTLTALLGTSALLSIISAPFSVWRQLTIDTASAAAFPSTVIFGIMLWALAIDGHILARAFSKPYSVGLIAAVIYFFFHAVVLAQLLQTGITG
jgi:hypothetical protein